MYDQLKRFEQIIFDVLSVLLVLFYSYAAVVQPASTQYHRGIYVIITYVLVFLLYKSKSTVMRVVDYILILLSIICIGYWILNFEAINYRTGAENAMDQDHCGGRGAHRHRTGPAGGGQRLRDHRHGDDPIRRVRPLCPGPVCPSG